MSTPGTHFCTFEINDFYYGILIEYYECTRIQLSDIPQDIIDEYNLEATHHDGWVYIDIQKGIPWLKQAGKIDNDHLCTHMEKYGYSPVRRTPNLWK